MGFGGFVRLGQLPSTRLGAREGIGMAAKKIQPKKPAAGTKSASGSKGKSKVLGRKTSTRLHRKSGRKTSSIRPGR